MHQAIEGLYGADVGKQPQLLAHSQQTLLRPHLGSGVVVEAWVSDAGKQYGVGFLTNLEGLFGEGVAHFINGMCAAQCFGEGGFVSESLCCGLQYGHTLFHDFWSDAITGQYSNLEFHYLYVFFCCRIVSSPVR